MLQALEALRGAPGCHIISIDIARPGRSPTMHHDTTLITTIVAGLVLAYIFGMIANRLRLPPLVGYLFAGILVGPHTPGFVADQELGAQLAELGVILLMFGVGLHFSLKDLMSGRAIRIPRAGAETASCPRP